MLTGHCTSIITPYLVSFTLSVLALFPGAVRSNKLSPCLTLMHASKDILWIHNLLAELACVSFFSTPTTLFCDNQDAIQLSHDSMFYGHTKHINIHFHFIHQTVSSGHITLKYCLTSDMIANMFTKSITTTKFEKFQELLGLG